MQNATRETALQVDLGRYLNLRFELQTRMEIFRMGFLSMSRLSRSLKYAQYLNNANLLWVDGRFRGNHTLWMKVSVTYL